MARVNSTPYINKHVKNNKMNKSSNILCFSQHGGDITIKRISSLIRIVNNHLSIKNDFVQIL